MTNDSSQPTNGQDSKPENSPSAEEQAKEAAAKAEQLRKQKQKEAIYNNFATPLAGTFLNLPREPVAIKCPACGVDDLSYIENDLKWWAREINNFVGCLFVTFCCCFCFNYVIPCKQTDCNHYCKNCGCYFGRAMEHKWRKSKAL